jgi:hypothetical protein
MQVEVLDGDAMATAVDVLAVKYAQGRYGLDAHVHQALLEAGVAEQEMSPPPGAFSLVPGSKSLAARSVLFVATPPLSKIRYAELGAFASTILSALAKVRPHTKTLALTLHGANLGLDEGESFVSMIAGLGQAVGAGTIPRQLARVVFVEAKSARADFIRKLLHEILPGGILQTSRSLGNATDGQDRLRAAAVGSASKRHVFVAMPFADDFQDVYDYAIQNAVNQSGLLCERADVTAFTGDILAHVQERIRTATLLIADLSAANPNVYLEVGYAWGCGIPCILLVRNPEELKFDVRGQRCIVYKRIRDLEKKLYDELDGLRAATASSAFQPTWPSRTLGPRS